MSHIYKVSEWKSGSGKWYCNDTSDLAGISGLWWVPVRLLGLTPAQYVEMLINTYKVDEISYNKEKNFLFFSWNENNYANMHKYLLYINRIARNKNFLV